MTTNETATARTLESGFAGRVLRPGDDGYEESRLPWQRRFDPRPALIAEAASAEDVAAAVRAAREHDLPLAIQATGHGAVLPADGALLLKTGALDGLEIDPAAGTARTGAATQWGDVIAAAGSYGLAPLSGTSTTVAVAGYTLGGGNGWLSRRFGYQADSLISAQVVTADGELVTASPDEHPDLFWALRGGGGNFGVVTALEFRLHEVPVVTVAALMYDADRARAALEAYREWVPGQPDESTASLALIRMPPAPAVPEPLRGRRVLAFRAMYAGGEAEARAAWGPVLEAAGEPLMGQLGEMRYADTAAAFGPPPPPSVGDMRLELMHELSDDVLDIVVESEASVMEVRQWSGAPARPAADAGPCGHREIPYGVVAGGITMDPAQYDQLAAALDDAVARLRPHATGKTFLNFLGEPGRASDAYTAPDFARLVEVKRAYDPDNLFRVNANIAP